MDKTLCVSAVWLNVFLWVAVLYADCPYKECSCSGNVILCQSRHLSFMPRIVSANVTGFSFLNMNDNNITIIPNSSLPLGLQDFNLQNNPLATIDDTAFDGSTKTLKSIEMSNIAFTKIPDAIGSLQALTYLHISDCNITDWNEVVMKKIGSTLRNLKLENVGLTFWPMWLQYFPYLNQLAIAGNYISSIPDDGLDVMTFNLTTLFLYNNLLTMVPKALYKLTHLLTLSLNQNQISQVSWLPQSRNLTSLSLSDNHISDSGMLTKILQPYATSLISLGMDKNLLTSIPDLSFLTQVNDLDLSYNRISDPSLGSAQTNLFRVVLAHNSLQNFPTIFARLSNVNVITLSWNSILIIQAKDFHSQTTYLDLGHNLITELTDSSFPVNSTMISLFINNNPLIRISDGALRNLPNLFELNLAYTNITSLPLGLSLLTRLGTLDVSNIAGLACTCLEKEPAAWIKTFDTPGNVIGDCGPASVYNFFTNLVSSCP